MLKVEIDSIRISLMSQDRVVMLKVEDEERYLPIWIGSFEAEAIRIELQGTQVSRPLTHDLLKSTIDQLGGDVEKVVVSSLDNDVFYASLIVKANGKQVEIDARPSDAIALAVRVKVPIFVDESVLEQASIEPAEEIQTSSDLAVTETDSEGESDLGVFKDFLDTLNLDDLDQSN